MKRILPALLIIGLIAAIVAVYWPVSTHDFLRYDDPLYIQDNPEVQNGVTLSGIAWAFSTLHTGNWYPVTWLSHMLDVELFGLNPAGHHWVNIGFHTANAVLIFLLLWRMTQSLWPSILIATFFALHPLRVESVAWVAERKDVLSTFFGLLTIAMYVSFVRTRHMWRYIVIMVLFAVSLMAKSMLVTLPFVLLLLDVWPLRRLDDSRVVSRRNPYSRAEIAQWDWSKAGRLVLEKVPLFLMVVPICIVTVIAQRHIGALGSFERINLGIRFENACMSYVQYLEKTFWPVDLAVFYPYPLAFSIWHVLLSILILVVITIVCLAVARRVPFLIIGWLWFIGTLVPVIGIIQVGAQSMADRYTYFPHIGLLLAVGWLFNSLCAISNRYVVAVVSLALVTVLAIASRQQVLVWKDSETLFRHALRSTNKNWVMHINYGTLLENQGELAAALQHFEVAAQIHPGDVGANFKVADVLARTGRISSAIDRFETVLKLQPDHRESLNNVAWFLASHPDIRVRNGDEAVRLAERACQLTNFSEPGFLDTLAAAYAETGRIEDAIATAEKALEFAENAHETELARSIEFHLQFYRAGFPYHMGATPPSR